MAATKYIRYAVRTRSGLARQCVTLDEARYIARGERADGWPSRIVRLHDDAEIAIDRRR